MEQKKRNKLRLQIARNIFHVAALRRLTEEQYEKLAIPENLKRDSKVQELFQKYGGLFGFDDNFGFTNVLEHEIQLKPGAKPIKQKQRKVPELHKIFISEQIKMLLEKDLIFEVDADWASPLVIVPKKGGKLRMCIDYRRLNELTIKLRYWSPFIQEDIINCLEEDRARVFAVLDLLSGYWQVKMAQNSIMLTAFTCFLGTFACRRLQFGLCTAVQTFQKLMNTVLAPLLGRTCFVYIDDIVVYARTNEELMRNLAEVFDLLMKARLTLSPSKCEFFTNEVQLLGQVIRDGKVQPQPQKLKVLQEFREPRSVKEI